MSNRYTVTVKDLMTLTGKSARACQRVFSSVKQSRSIRPGADLPLHVLCDVLGWDETKVRQLLRD